MSIYGSIEVQNFQLTPLGVQRVQTRTIRGLSTADRQVLKEIVERGGIAELDEITVGGVINPNTVAISLSHLIDLGYITPVNLETTTLGTTSPSISSA